MTDSTGNNHYDEPDHPQFEARRADGRKKLILIFALFAVPLLLATLWFHAVRMNGGSWGNTAKGQLITPAVPLDGVSLSENGQPFDIDGFRGKWTILYVPDGLKCLESCGKHLYDIRQLRLALNHRMERVQRVVILDQPELPAELRDAQIGLRVVSGSQQQQQAFMDQLGAPTATFEPIPDAIYLVDPFGNLMMRFRPDQMPRELHKDLKRLLKASRIG